MSSYICPVCGYIHNDDLEEECFESLPEDWKCPECDLLKGAFEEMLEE